MGPQPHLRRQQPAGRPGCGAGRPGSRWCRRVQPPAAGAGGAAPAPPGGGGRGPGGRAANPFVTRFEAVPAFSTLVSGASTRLRADLFAGGVAATSLRTWSTLLAEEADDLLDAGTLEEERAAIAAYFV